MSTGDFLGEFISSEEGERDLDEMIGFTEKRGLKRINIKGGTQPCLR